MTYIWPQPPNCAGLRDPLQLLGFGLSHQIARVLDPPPTTGSDPIKPLPARPEDCHNSGME